MAYDADAPTDQLSVSGGNSSPRLRPLPDTEILGKKSDLAVTTADCESLSWRAAF